MNQFSLLQAVDRLRQGVVIVVALAAHRRLYARFVSVRQPIVSASVLVKFFRTVR